LRWILDHHAVSTVIPGATKMAQAEENAAASGLPPLAPELHRQLRELYDREIAPAIRGPY
jgi:aryl-alcohol dehydrogenase-like predicted oxidoreductase